MSADTLPKAHFQSLDELEGHYWWHQNRLHLALSLLRQTGHKPDSCLDVGCGTGGFLQSLIRHLPVPGTAMGLDTSPTAIDYARSKGLQVFPQDLMSPFSLSKTFELITAMDVLEHLPEETPLLQSVFRHLTPGGFFLASVPAHPSLFTSWDRQLGHHRRYLRSDLLRKVSAAGLTVCRCTYAFSYILAPAILRRYGGHDYQADTCIFPPISPMANRTLLWAGKMESLWARHFPVPFGLSIFLLAQKKAG